MTAYYNEKDPNAAAWLRTLIAEGHIAPGEVDERSIVDVRPDELGGFSQCHFFAGIGGWSLALRLTGWPDDRPVWTGSCPCQPFSAAGRRKGFADERHLWPEQRRLIAERRPPKFFGEQVASAADWLRLVRGDLEALDYAVGAIPIEAASAGADHLRDRFWFVADRQEQRRQDRDAGTLQGPAERRRPPEQSERCGGDGGDMANTLRDRTRSGSASGDRPEEAFIRIDRRLPRSGIAAGLNGETEWVCGADGKARRVKSGVRLLAHGFPSRVGLLRGFGNAIDPRPAAAFIRAAS